ncbi:Na(+)/H(+) antiporter subunit B [bacterium]|nr:Na(+)/H(+) antiporter subunit B [bacterium]
MPELYLRLLARIMTPVLIALSIFLLLRGHNLPGGGFIAGLMAAVSLELQILSTGDFHIRRRIGRFMQPAIGIGIAAAIVAAIIGYLNGGFFKGVWWNLALGPLHIDLGTPQLFDIGVYITVIAVTSSFLLGLSQSAERT